MESRKGLNLLPVLSRCSAFYKHILIGKQFLAIFWSNVKAKFITVVLHVPGISVVNLHNFFHKLVHLQRKVGQYFNSHFIAFSLMDFQRLKLNSNGTEYSILQLLSESEMQQMLVHLHDNVPTNELQQLHLMIEQNESIAIIHQNLPPSPPIYEHRTLLKRCSIDKKILMKNNDDIFVISGIAIQELSHMATPDIIAYSGDQINEITAKLILLENIDHWCQILVHSTHPVHLLEFDPDEKIFILQKTQGTSKLLRSLLGTNYESMLEISEESLIAGMPIYGSGLNKVCICDSPGMGKSFLLVRLARLAIQEHDLVLYIRVSDLLEELYQSYMRNIDCKQAVQFLIYKYATPAGLARKLLQAMFQVKTTLSLSLFLDGLDEVSRKDQEYTKHVVKEIIASFPNVKLFMVARPHMRSDLEKSLGLTTFGISPLSHQLQINLMVTHLREKVKKFQVVPSDQLQNWVNIRVKTFCENQTPDEFSISGIPLQCHLITEVIMNATRQQNYNFLELDTFQIETIVGDTLFDLYKNHVELHYHKHMVSFSKNRRRKSLSIPVEHIRFNPDSSIKKCYQVLALQTLFPSLMRANLHDFGEKITQRSENFHKVIRNSLNDFFSHHSVAEYLVAEFIADSLGLAKNTLSASHCSEGLTKLLEFLFFTVLATPQESYQSTEDGKTLTVSEFRSHDLSFYNLSIVYFLNGHLFTKMIHPEVYSQSAELMVSKIGTKAVVGILQSSLRHDFINIYYFAANLLLSLPPEYPMYMSKTQLNILIRVACMHSSLELFKKLTRFIEKSYLLTLQDICDFCLDNNMLSILQYTCFYVSFDKLKYLVDMNCQIENQTLLYICARNSAYDSNEKHESRVNIIGFLTEKNKYLIQERDHQGNTALFAESTSVDIIKMLIDKGADATVTNLNGKTMAHQATTWMSASVFHQLVLLLVSQGQCAKVFAIKDLHGQTPLEYAFRNVKFLQSDTVNMIYDAIERLSYQETLSCNDNPAINLPLLPTALASMHKIKPRQQWRPFCEEYSTLAESDHVTLGIFGTNNSFARDFTDGKGFCVTSVHNEFWCDQNVIVKTTKLEPGNYTLWDNANNIKTILDCCRHENIARYYSINLCKKKMELVTVKESYRLTLQQWLKNESRLKIFTEDTEILQQTTNGMAFLHENGIVHGNIKPENIFVVQLSPKEIRVKLSDIEISHTLFGDQQDLLFSTRRYSVEWTAPEAIEAHDVTTGMKNLKLSEAGDIFSLGCLFYYILSNGTHPFGSSSDEIESNIKTNNKLIQPDKLKGPYIGYLHLIFSMIDKKPQNRPPVGVVKKHHIFWPRKVCLSYLVAVSNAADQPLEGSSISKCLDEIERHPLMVIYCEPEGSTGWMRFLCKDVQKYVQGHGCKRKPYCGDLIFDLLRAIRNMQTHYMTLPPVVKNGLGEIPRSYCDYWLLRFPVLVDLVWLTFQKLKHDTSCGLSDYYCRESDFNFLDYSEHENKLLGRCVRVRSARIILHGKI